MEQRDNGKGGRGSRDRRTVAAAVDLSLAVAHRGCRAVPRELRCRRCRAAVAGVDLSAAVAVQPWLPRRTSRAPVPTMPSRRQPRRCTSKKKPQRLTGGRCDRGGRACRSAATEPLRGMRARGVASIEQRLLQPGRRGAGAGGEDPRVVEPTREVGWGRQIRRRRGAEHAV